MAQFELKIEEESVTHPDPLVLWNRYIKWVEANFPKGDSKITVLSILERCTKTLTKHSRYKEDKRFLRMWIKYADLDKEREMEIFNFLDNKDYFTTLALFYIARAVVAEKNGNVRLADDTYKLGINRSAKPLDKLKSRRRQFERRMSRRWLNAQNQDEQQDEESAKITRKKHALKTIRGRSSSHQQTATSSSSSSSNRNEGFAVFQDTNDENRHVAPAKVSSWKEMSTHQSAKKENTKRATNWTEQGGLAEENPRRRHRRRSRSQEEESTGGFVIHADERKDEVKQDTKKKKKKHRGLLERPREDGSVIPYVAGGDEEEKKQKKKKKASGNGRAISKLSKKKKKKKTTEQKILWAFKRSEVGNGVKEMSFEELRARCYRGKRKQQERGDDLVPTPAAVRRDVASPPLTVVPSTAVIGRRLSFNTSMIEKHHQVQPSAVKQSIVSADEDDVTINTKNVLHDLADAFASPGLSWGVVEKEEKKEKKEEFAIFKDDEVKEELVQKKKASFPIFQDDGEEEEVGEDDPTMTQKIPTFAIFQDDDGEEEEEVGEDDPTVTQQIPTFAIFQDGDDDDEDNDQENATPPRSKSTRKNRPFRTSRESLLSLSLPLSLSLSHTHTHFDTHSLHNKI